MFTPQQIEQISFGTAAIGGYDRKAVDAVLEPLTEDYITLYKENALLKSKMKVLVSKLEEYRANESSMKDAMVNAQKTCDMMVKEAEAKCAQMLSEANDTALENAKNAEALVAAENDRIEEAKQTASIKIDEMLSQLDSCMQALIRIKENNRPAHPLAGNAAFDYDQVEGKHDPADSMADEISASLQALVGTTDDTAPTAEPHHPVADTTTKFANLQFGKNYEVSQR